MTPHAHMQQAIAATEVASINHVPMDGQVEQASPYKLSEEELLSLAIPKLSPGLSLDENLVEPPSNRQSATKLEAWSHDLALLDSVPLEIQQAILNGLDIRSLASFRLVNRKANVLFQELPKCTWAASNIPKVLFAIHLLGTGKWTSYEELYDELHRSDCENCGNFGSHFYLLTCKRICRRCLTDDDKYLPLRLYRAHQKFGISESVLLEQPHMLSLPGIYSAYNHEIQRRKLLVDRQSAYSAALKIHGSADIMASAVSRLQAEEEDSFANQNRKGGGRRSRHRRRGDMLDTGMANPFRFVAIISLPWINKEDQRLEWGIHCRGCREYTSPEEMHYARKYSLQGFRDHIHQLGAVYRVECTHSERWRHRGQPRPDHWPE